MQRVHGLRAFGGQAHHQSHAAKDQIGLGAVCEKHCERLARGRPNHGGSGQPEHAHTCGAVRGGVCGERGQGAVRQRAPGRRIRVVRPHHGGKSVLGAARRLTQERPQTCRFAPGPPRRMRKLGSGPAFSHEV
jgi:hypothetical protein